MRVGGQLHALAALPPGKRPGTHCIGGWVGPRTGLDQHETTTTQNATHRQHCRVHVNVLTSDPAC
jgi:hypothetical protein